MTCEQIHIRDPFVLYEGGVYYMYGTRARDFGLKTGGFDVYVSHDMIHWSEPQACFDSERYQMNTDANWAPEVHKYHGAYYMLATFTRAYNGLRGTCILRAEHPLGPFVPHSRGVVTPEAWECLDGTLYVRQDGTPYLVFCHEHTQIIDGTICYVPLSDDLTERVGEPVTLFAASEPYWVGEKQAGEHYVTDGPFLHRSRDGELFMLWSSFIDGAYAECCVRFLDGELGERFEHQTPLLTDDGGHGMIFRADDKLYLTFHSPNVCGQERPCFLEIEENGDTLRVV